MGGINGYKGQVDGHFYTGKAGLLPESNRKEIGAESQNSNEVFKDRRAATIQEGASLFQA